MQDRSAHVTDVWVSGFEKKGRKYVYTIETTWSNETKYEIYRRYAAFFSFQNSLLRMFPVEAGKIDASERVIPALSTVDNMLKILGCTNSESVMQSRLKTINHYCQVVLLKLDPKIAHCKLVLGFFQPTAGDKELKLKLSRPPSLHPQRVPAGSVFEEHIVLADCEIIVGVEDSHVPAKAGEKVLVVNKDKTGWCLVSRVSDKKTGWVPESFLIKPQEVLDDFLGDITADGNSNSDGDESITSGDPELYYCAIAEYSSDDPTHVSFPEGARVLVIDQDEDGWWFVSYMGKEGWAPFSYLELENDDFVESLDEVATDTPVTQNISGGNGELAWKEGEYYSKEDYVAELEDEVSFPNGATIEVLNKSVSGWWTVRYEGRVGLAPATFLSNSSSKVDAEQCPEMYTSGISKPPPRRKTVYRASQKRKAGRNVVWTDETTSNAKENGTNQSPLQHFSVSSHKLNSPLQRKKALRELETAKSLATSTSTSPPTSLPRGSRLNLRPVIGPKEHYITDVMVVGYKKQHNNYVYVINTTWSDRYRYEIYRRYGEFFTFQNTLQQLFPLESGIFKSSERILPTLPTIDNVLSILGRTNSESILKSRLKTINEYCHILLLQLDPHISRSVFVVNFFKPYPGDKQLARLEKPRGQSLTMSVYPQDIPAGSLFEEYMVIADHRATAGSELSVKAGEIVKVIKKEETGWWLVSRTRTHGEEQWEAPKEEDEEEEGEDKKKVAENVMGYIPGSFLKKYEEGSLEFQDTVELEEKYLGFVSSTADQEVNQSLKYTAIEDYYTDDPRQICFKKGDPLIVVETSEDGWWLVTHDGKEGWAPASYLKSTSKSALATAETEMTESVGAQNYIAKMAYTAQLDDEISLPRHAAVEVIEKSITGWWTIRYNGRVGVAPASLLTLVSHYRVPRQFKFPLTADLGHSISGINQPPPRRELFLSQQTVTHDDMAIKNSPLLEEHQESQSYSDSETEFLASNKRKKFNFRSRLMTFVLPKSRDDSLAKATKKRHKTLSAKDHLGEREVISNSNASNSLIAGAGNSQEQASSAKDESSKAREGNLKAWSSKSGDLEVTTTEAGVAAMPTEGSKNTHAEIVVTEGGNFTANTKEGTTNLDPATSNGPQSMATEEGRIDSATEVSTDNVATSVRVEEDELVDGEPVCSSMAEDIDLPQPGASDIETSSNNGVDEVDVGMAEANPSGPELKPQSPKAVRLRCTSSQCILEPAVADQEP